MKQMLRKRDIWVFLAALIGAFACMTLIQFISGRIDGVASMVFLYPGEDRPGSIIHQNRAVFHYHHPLCLSRLIHIVSDQHNSGAILPV